MRTSVILILAVSLLLIGPAAGQGKSQRSATLKLSKGTPLTLRGAHFDPRERVRVTVSNRLKRTKVVNAGASGSFVVSFQDSYDRCTGLFARAVGTGGSRATLKMPQLGCPPRL
jgi:hypothetical protein